MSPPGSLPAPRSQPKFIKSIFYTCYLYLLVSHSFLNPSVWLLLPSIPLKLLWPRSQNAVLVFSTTPLTISFWKHHFPWGSVTDHSTTRHPSISLGKPSQSPFLATLLFRYWNLSVFSFNSPQPLRHLVPSLGFNYHLCSRHQICASVLCVLWRSNPFHLTSHLTSPQ